MNQDSTSLFWATCPTCDHEWVAAELPMTIEQFAVACVKAGEACPNCGFSGARAGRAAGRDE